MGIVKDMIKNKQIHYIGEVQLTKKPSVKMKSLFLHPPLSSKEKAPAKLLETQKICTYSVINIE